MTEIIELIFDKTNKFSRFISEKLKLEPSSSKSYMGKNQKIRKTTKKSFYVTDYNMYIGRVIWETTMHCY